MLGAYSPVSLGKIGGTEMKQPRRYAIFTSLLYGDYTIVVRGADIETAPKWGGFVSWLGGLK